MGNELTALALLSGGLDSIIAARLIMGQGIRVIGIYFSSPFWSNEDKEKYFISDLAKQSSLEIAIEPVGDAYIDIIKNPGYGLGKEINPCVDCKIFMLKKAKDLMKKYNASFLISGEVVGQRPMSQHKSALNYIEKNADVRGILVRPLSAKLLPPTEPELKGLINRDKLEDISGRTRKRQNELAKKFGLTAFTSPAGGCLLTQKVYANKLRDLFEYNDKLTMKEIELLNYGRHFRYNKSKIIVGRNEKENNFLKNKKNKDDYLFEIPDVSAPTTLLQEEKNDTAVKFAADLTLLYSDLNEKEYDVVLTSDNSTKIIHASFNMNKDEVSKYNLSFK